MALAESVVKNIHHAANRRYCLNGPERREVGSSNSAANPWLALDAASAPTLRAQELRFAWERFLGEDDQPEDLVRGPIADSWRRSLEAGVDWTGHRLAPVMTDEDEAHELYEEHPLGRHSSLIH